MSQNPARKLTRRLKRDSKVVGQIPGAPGQPTPGHEHDAPAPRETKVKLPLAAGQVSILRGAQAKVADAQKELEASLRMVLAQHGIVEGRVTQVLDGRPPCLEVMVPEKAKKAKKGR